MFHIQTNWLTRNVSSLIYSRVCFRSSELSWKAVWWQRNLWGILTNYDVNITSCFIPTAGSPLQETSLILISQTQFLSLVFFYIHQHSACLSYSFSLLHQRPRCGCVTSDAAVAVAAASSGGQTVRCVLKVGGQGQATGFTSKYQLSQCIQSISFSSAQ